MKLWMEQGRASGKLFEGEDKKRNRFYAYQNFGIASFLLYRGYPLDMLFPHPSMHLLRLIHPSELLLFFALGSLDTHLVQYTFTNETSK